MTARHARFGAWAALAVFLGGAAPAPDLAVPRETLRRDGRRARVVVVNLGDAASPATTLELRDRPVLGGVTGGSSLYPFTPNQSGIWLFQEPADRRTLLLNIGLGSGVERGAPGGKVVLRDVARVALVSPVEGVQLLEGNVVSFQAPPPGGRWIRLLVTPAKGRVPEAEFILDVLGRTDMPVFHGPRGDVPAIRTTLRLDALSRPAARRATVDVPALRAGETRELSVRLSSGWNEVFAWVDPENQVAEIREGNNVTSWREDRDRRTLAALHLHSSFSEGAGSVDWQVFHGAGSGYDLMWWSEHDWRMACRDHLEEIRFGDTAQADTLEFDAAGTTTAASVDYAAQGEGGAHALRLEAPRGNAEAAVVTIADERKRFAYSLAADLTLEVRVLLERLDADDRFAVIAELSHHPGEKRRLEYSIRWDGVSEADRDRSDAVRKAVARTVPTGSWVTLRLPLSHDAAELWSNGLDSNLQGLRFSLTSGGSGAAATLQSVRVTHEDCGAALRRVQESWMENYPNVAHQFADEVSFVRPHLNQYGGTRGLFDYEAIWDEQRVGDIVERVRGTGGLVSWCHPLGVRAAGPARDRFGAEYRRDLVSRRFGGTDVLEVGFREKGSGSLGDYFALWDEAGALGTIITGIGVNDSHERDWSSTENNFGTWLSAPAEDGARLREALRRGRAVFGDPLQFRGTLSIACDEAGPGDTVIGPGEVVARLTRGPRDTRVKIVVDGRVRREGKASRGEGRWSVRLRAGEARVVRVEAWSATGEPLAFTNPIYFDVDGAARRGSERR